MAAAKKTRATKRRTSAKKTATKRASSSAAAKKATAARKAAKSAEAEETRNKARAEAAAAREQERKDAIKAGDLIVGKGVEFTRSQKDDDGVVLTKAKDIVDALKASDVPVKKRDIAEPNIMSVGIFAALKALGVVEEFRAKTGERGGSGVAYLWVGKK